MNRLILVPQCLEEFPKLENEFASFCDLTLYTRGEDQNNFRKKYDHSEHIEHDIVTNTNQKKCQLVIHPSTNQPFGHKTKHPTNFLCMFKPHFC